MNQDAAQAVIVATSFVARGSVGLRATGFALERLGHPVWAVPTVFLPWHPGHGRATRSVPDAGGFAAGVEELADSRWLDEVGAIVTGYLGAADQATALVRLVETAKARRPEILYFCDPVIGDEAGLYVPEATATAIRDRLLPLADIATPNRHELGWLTGQPTDSVGAALAAARALGPARVLATSVPALMRNSVAMVYATPHGAFASEHPLVAHTPRGAGDLAAGLLAHQILAGASDELALERTAAGAFEIVARSARAGADELAIVVEQGRLPRPMAMVQMRRLAEAKG
ncbi:pyridoxal kinase [Amorphus sp. 3PC139-8]|uniref:pyridoxal kinase n=1 Tax=Amorphus sp. 3PC139-8 TaxID=2735676 RepID=UPI00345D25D9